MSNCLSLFAVRSETVPVVSQVESGATTASAFSKQIHFFGKLEGLLTTMNSLSFPRLECLHRGILLESVTGRD